MFVWYACSVATFYRALCDLMYCSLPSSSVHGISQARILESVAISSSRRSSWPRDRTRISWIGRQILYHWVTWEDRLYSIYKSKFVFFSALHALWYVPSVIFPIIYTEFQLFPQSLSIPLKPARHLVSMYLLQRLLLGWFWVTLLCSQFPSLTAPKIYFFEVLGGSDNVLRHWKRITK